MTHTSKSLEHAAQVDQSSFLQLSGAANEVLAYTSNCSCDVRDIASNWTSVDHDGRTALTHLPLPQKRTVRTQLAHREVALADIRVAPISSGGTCCENGSIGCQGHCLDHVLSVHNSTLSMSGGKHDIGRKRDVCSPTLSYWGLQLDYSAKVLCLAYRTLVLPHDEGRYLNLLRSSILQFVTLSARRSANRISQQVLNMSSICSSPQSETYLATDAEVGR